MLGGATSCSEPSGSHLGPQLVAERGGPVGPSFPLLPLGWLGARRACCSLRRPHHWPGTEGDPRPRGPPTQPSESPTCASWGPRPPWEPARPPCAPEVRAPARASCELTPAPRLLHGGWAPVSVHCTGERGCLRGCVPRPSLLRGCPVAALLHCMSVDHCLAWEFLVYKGWS